MAIRNENIGWLQTIFSKVLMDFKKNLSNSLDFLGPRGPPVVVFFLFFSSSYNQGWRAVEVVVIWCYLLEHDDSRCWEGTHEGFHKPSFISNSCVSTIGRWDPLCAFDDRYHVLPLKTAAKGSIERTLARHFQFQPAAKNCNSKPLCATWRCAERIPTMRRTFTTNIRPVPHTI